MNVRKGFIVALGAATVAATAGSAAFGVLDPTSGTATGGGGGGGGGGGTAVVVGTAGCTSSSSNTGVVQVVDRSPSRCGSVHGSVKANHDADGGKGGNGGHARSGSAFNRF